MVRDFAEKLSVLVLKKGIALRRNQSLHIVVGPKSYEYAEVMAEEAYRLGAKYVYIEVLDPRVSAARANYQDDENLSFVPSYIKNFQYEMISEDWARIRIDSGEDRVGKIEEDRRKAQIITKAIRQIGKEYSERTMRSELAWNVCAVPGPLWAKEILGDDASEKDLADILSRIYRFDRDDFIKAWDDFDKKACSLSDKLNSIGIQMLHYKSPVTDFRIGFRKEARFSGGAGTLADGTKFFANLPTEEIFSSPDMFTAEGYITTTKPVTVMNQKTENVTLFFEKGRVVDVKAKTGLDIMKTFLDTDEGSRRIGECALVSASSPISRCGISFGSILIDENASCHIALGASYPECLTVGSKLRTDEEMHSYGLNTSLVHVDFMVGSPDLDIDAYAYDGKIIPIMRKGEFTL